MTNSGSNSEGSGPFPAGAALASVSFDFPDRFEGESVRELDRRGTEPERDPGDWVDARCLACSSAILASIAPLKRFSGVSSGLYLE